MLLYKKKHKKWKQQKAELREAQRLSRAEDEMILEDIRAYVGGASSSSAPKVIEHTTGGTFSSESQMLLTLPPTTEAAPPYTMSMLVTTCATIEVPWVTPP
ncbi:hypothetical protein HAX54_028829 [Datura stramonium]|uniref:Uncharacterized protein n=1 Tax=Datura stramonium TaxID=4076 RepID=A0ABS8S9W8_DATST|nr:hypothetical protein [Datura stramonium]